jgi:hypothetical protein
MFELRKGYIMLELRRRIHVRAGEEDTCQS